MPLNGNGKIALIASAVGVLSVVVTIFIMLVSGLDGSVREVQSRGREQGERITAVEVELEGIDEKVDDIRTEQRGIREDVKKILQALD